MNIKILSRRSSLFSTRRLVEAARERGHEAQVIDYLRCYMNIASTGQPWCMEDSASKLTL